MNTTITINGQAKILTENHFCLLQIYSDLYKEANGFRPQGINYHEWSENELSASFDRLVKQSEANAVEEKKQSVVAVAVFKALVQRTIKMGAGDEKTALRWLYDAENVEEDYEFFAYKHQIQYTEYWDSIKEQMLEFAQESQKELQE